MEYNNLDDVNLREFLNERSVGELNWKDPDLAEIVRIRYLTDEGAPYWDISYVWGRNKAGQKVRVLGLPYQLKRGVPLVNQLVKAAKADGVYLKGLCGGDINGVLSYFS